MNTFPTLPFRGPVFWAVLLGIAALAVAHHGNPQAPTTAPWYESPLPGSISR